MVYVMSIFRLNQEKCKENLDIQSLSDLKVDWCLSLLTMVYVMSIFRLNQEKCKENLDIQSLSDLKVGQCLRGYVVKNSHIGVLLR